MLIATQNNEPDITPNTDEFTSSMGNYIYIKIDDQDTYLILAHFKQDSILVNVGDHVEKKQMKEECCKALFEYVRGFTGTVY